ncbi:efflux RND transporter periplasmic adaptor subunit [Ammoniphilus sp. CFH 90114]|uniref:efflux RND transporter periplasmic adaptor subunit n=1 Tax=Ammoniphilus sp. CFH 90114 TaxID=2493665 RepID=UPI00100FB663|nr:efflux RND transporter periplasmic adaptor subunit [Ammoniphilus sp. CFH 90114]RXT01127.1 efflux RND transporter periplasmic adaptor subunit [Ammoniphilus sp. CFH 90114]
MRNSTLTILLAATLTTTVLSGCSLGAKEAMVAEAEVKTVEAAPVSKQAIQRTLVVSGTLEPVEETLISFEIGGRITGLSKEQGDAVRAGEVLGKLEDQDYQLQVQRAQTGVAQAEAGLAKVNSGAREQEIKQAQLLVEKAQLNADKAQDDLKKIEELYQHGAVAKDTWENATLRVEIALKDLETAQNSLALTQEGARKEDIDQTQSLYQQQIVQKQQAELTLKKTTLVSSSTGTVIAKLVNEGQLVSGGTPVYRVGNVNQLKVILPVPDREISLWQIGAEVTIKLYDQERKGKVSKIYPSTNAGTGTVGVEVLVDNSDRKWLVGQVVTGSYEMKGKEGLFVPVASVIRTGGDKPYVFIVEGDKAVKTEVVIGQLVDGKLEILSGLQEGQMVVSKGADRLFDEDAIEVRAGGEQK